MRSPCIRKDSNGTHQFTDVNRKVCETSGGYALLAVAFTVHSYFFDILLTFDRHTQSHRNRLSGPCYMHERIGASGFFVCGRGAGQQRLPSGFHKSQPFKAKTNQ